MPLSFERPPVLTFTNVAADRLAALAAKGGGRKLLLALENAGCAGMAYRLDYAEEANPAGEVVALEGAELVIAPEALMFVLGTKVDYRMGEMESGFVFDNPNQTDECGCGESVSLTKAELPD